MREKRRRWDVLGAALLFLVMGLLFVPECDDCYFVFWDFASWKDFLLTRPITEGAKIVGVPANGRYLGNLLGVLQGKIYFTPLGFLRGILMGGALFALTLLLARRFCSSAVGRREAFALAFALVILAPRGTWQQVYAWGAGLVNYLLPMVGLLLLLDMAQRGRGGPRQLLLAALLSFACALFMEPVTILLLLAGPLCTLWALRRSPRHLPLAAAVWVGGALGGLLMFTASGYAQAGSDNRSIGLDLAFENLHYIVTETLVRPAPAAVLISVLLLFLLRAQGCRRWKLWASLLLPLHLLCLADMVLDLSRAWGSYTLCHLALGCALALLWLICLGEWKGRAARGRVLALVLALCALNGPLLVVSPVGPRNFFPGYVVLLLIAAQLYAAARSEGLCSLRLLGIPAAAAALALVLVYGCNFTVYHQRLDYALQQVQAGENQLTLPLVPFNGWVTNELPGKGDISYLVYRETPWDVGFTFLPYGAFLAQDSGNFPRLPGK